MKASTKLSLAIFIGLIVFSTSYVWINRFEFITYDKSDSMFFIVNKWTGETCAVIFNADHTPVSENKMFEFCPAGEPKKIFLP
jgi:hypothetical protein|tara:strand:+ start:694 stop:942 length:249 start_codon:yes stop_codon:yes gene_type:complete